MNWRLLLCGLFLTAIAGMLLLPIHVRHSAKYGFTKTVDFDRGIGVNGGYVSPNYDNFDRLDLDFRSYTPGQVYDVRLHVRETGTVGEPIRTVSLSLPSDTVEHRKAPLANPFTTVSFDPIPDSAGRIYYVWIERGPRNRDANIALWSIKSYSRMHGYQLAKPAVNLVREQHSAWFVQGLVISTLAVCLVAGMFLAREWFKDGPRDSDT